MRITENLLREMCVGVEERKQIAVFRKEWPEGCELTASNLLRAAELNLCIMEFVRRLCGPASTARVEESAPREWRRRDRLEEWLYRRFWTDYRLGDVGIAEYRRASQQYLHFVEMAYMRAMRASAETIIVLIEESLERR